MQCIAEAFLDHEALLQPKYGFKTNVYCYAKRNLYWIPQEFDAIVGIGTTFPAPNPEALKGKKIRTTGLWGEYINVLAATPVSIPWGDVYMAAKLGTVDGWCGGVASLEELKLKEVAKGYVVSPNITLSPGAFLINKRSYDALPKDIQDIILKVGHEFDNRLIELCDTKRWR
jgi:TRAP-type C4-dicarboxylate transport system substrate-binding protein